MLDFLNYSFSKSFFYYQIELEYFGNVTKKLDHHNVNLDLFIACVIKSFIQEIRNFKKACLDAV